MEGVKPLVFNRTDTDGEIYKNADIWILTCVHTGNASHSVYFWSVMGSKKHEHTQEMFQ